MSTTTERPAEPTVPAPPTADLTTPSPAEDAPASNGWPVRLAVALAFPVAGAGLMVGGIFEGSTGRADAILAGLLGIGLAVVLSRSRKALVTNSGLLVGVFLIGLLIVVPNGVDAVTGIRDEVARSARSGDVLRPPVPLDAGWQAIIAWIMALVGAVAGWTAIVLRRPALGFLGTLPVMALAAISVPKDAQVASGLAVLALLALGLGVLSGDRDSGDGEEPQSVGFEVRRTLRSLPLVAAVTGVLFRLSQTNILFPRPVIDPSQEPQRPKAVPLSAVTDRVLFEVESSVTGPWRTGSLDVYQDDEWLLPPFAASTLHTVPRDGVIDPTLTPGTRATITVAGLTGAVLPALPNLVGVVAKGPRLVYDDRNDNLRIDQGQVTAGYSYIVAAATLPTVAQLRLADPQVSDEVREFISVPRPPAAVETVLREAQGANKWDRFDVLRRRVLETVVASGTGSPVAVSPDRVADLLTGSKEGSPFEIVAAQALLARWVGVPSRIGYGFDGGEKVGEILQVRPKNGAVFVEVFFPGFGWLPVIGTPKSAKPSVGGDPSQQQANPNVLPSDDIAAELYVPEIVPPDSATLALIRRVSAVVVPVLVGLVLAYFLFPALRKALIRGRRRRAAIEAGPRSRIALAYAEWRDYATDYGFGYQTDTPLAFLSRFVADAEHRELAWLVTRVLWGDLQAGARPHLATVAEELSRTLRRRLASSQPPSLRFIAVISRLSLRRPYLADAEQPGAAVPGPSEKEESRAPSLVA